MAGFEQCRGDVVITLDAATCRTRRKKSPRHGGTSRCWATTLVATVRNNRQDSAFRRWPSRPDQPGRAAFDRALP